jgi:uncharacterized protein CbrC (UPF0167 family)
VTRFADLGVSFPLFEGAVEDAVDFAGSGSCSLCLRHSTVRFELGIGSDVLVPCQGCGLIAALDADDAEDGTCRRCDHLVPYPTTDETTYCCVECLRGGQAAITKDSELGMFTWEQAVSGVSHGVPGLLHPDFEMVAYDGGWTGARVAAPLIVELLRTPTYSTIQGERWLFCCKQPMIYLGAWSRLQFTEEAPDGDGKALLEAMLNKSVPGLWEDSLHDTTGIYVFKCGACGRKRAHWDIA